MREMIVVPPNSMGSTRLKLGFPYGPAVKNILTLRDAGGTGPDPGAARPWRKQQWEKSHEWKPAGCSHGVQRRRTQPRLSASETDWNSCEPVPTSFSRSLTVASILLVSVLSVTYFPIFLCF